MGLLDIGVERFHMQQYFSYIVVVSFVCGGNWSTNNQQP